MADITSQIHHLTLQGPVFELFSKSQFQAGVNNWKELGDNIYSVDL